MPSSDDDGADDEDDEPAVESSFEELLARINASSRRETGSHEDATSQPERPGAEGDADDGSVFGDLVSQVSEREESAADWEWVGQDAEAWSKLSTSPPQKGVGITDSKGEALLELLGDTANVLVLGPADCPAEYDICTKLESSIFAESVRSILITYDQPPQERLNNLTGYRDRTPAETVILHVGDRNRRRSGSQAVGGESVTVEHIGSRRDLMRLGITVSKHLATGDEEEGPDSTVLCFHSLTSLIQVVDDLKVVFRFLHILLGRISSVGAHAHYHLDPDAHDRETIATLETLFDVSIEYDEDGSISVNR